MAAHGTGSLNPTMALCEVIDTADVRYIQLTQEFLLYFQQTYDIDYWKFDGFVSRPSRQTEYYGLPLWIMARWVAMFAALRADFTAAGNNGLFINATRYVPLSSWLLQWGPQNHSRVLVIRCACGLPAVINNQQYFNLFGPVRLQFLLAVLYNHVPIYGVSTRNTQINIERISQVLILECFSCLAVYGIVFFTHDAGREEMVY